MYIQKIIDIAIPSKYLKWYCNIILNALERNRIVDEPTDRHHILPKSFNLGGEKDKQNLVLLTLREHFICHRLLIEMFDGDKKQKMIYALWRMVGSKKLKMSSREYSNIRSIFIKSKIGVCASQATKDKMSRSRKGKTKTKEHRLSLSIAKTGKSNGREGTKLTQETKNKMSISAKGKRLGRIPWNKGLKITKMA